MQKVFPEGLSAALEKQLLPCYLLNGQDLLLVNESKDKLIQAAREHGFDEKIAFSISPDTQWEILFEQVQSNGLFSPRQIVLLNLSDSPNALQQKKLAELGAMMNPDLLLIFHIPKLSKTIEKQRWFIQLENHALLINCHTPDISKMPTWLFHRAKAMALHIDADAVQFLCYSFEGNLLALNQTLQMLALRFPDHKISLTRAKDVVEQASQFTPFQWVDALLAGKIVRASRILTHLYHEDIQPIVLLRLIQKELFLLLEITRSPKPIKQTLQPLYQANLFSEFERLKIWQNRRALYQNAIAHLNYRQLFLLIQQLAELEKLAKQAFSDEIWQRLEQFTTQFSIIK